MLYIFGGLPGAGKSALSRSLARARQAVYLRIDTIEQAMRDGGCRLQGPEGYMVAYAAAADNLRLGGVRDLLDAARRAFVSVSQR